MQLGTVRQQRRTARRGVLCYHAGTVSLTIFSYKRGIMDKKDLAKGAAKAAANMIAPGSTAAIKVSDAQRRMLKQLDLKKMLSPDLDADKKAE